MLPEVEQFIAAVNVADAAWVAAFGAAQAAYEAKEKEADLEHDYGRGFAECPACIFDSSPAGDERRAAKNAADATRTGAIEAARASLAESSVPLVRWIAKNVSMSYSDEAIAILRELPAPLEELDAIARREGWCTVYADFRRRALRAGVISKPAPAEASAE